MRGRKKAGADKVEEVDTPVAVSEDDSEMTPVDEDDAAELEKILIEEEEVVDDSPEIEKEVSKEEAEATEELSNAVVLETAEKPTKAADTIIEKPALDDTAMTDDTAKTDDTAEDLAIIIDNDEDLTSEVVEDTEVVKNAKGVPEIYSEELPSKLDEKPKNSNAKPSAFIMKLVECKICHSTCTRGVTMACCGTQACRGCATKAVTAKKICWNCPMVSKTDSLINDEELRTAAKLFKEGEFVPKEVVEKIKARLGKTKTRKDNKKKQALKSESDVDKGGEKTKEKQGDDERWARSAVPAAYFKFDFPILMKLNQVSPDCKAITFEKRDHMKTEAVDMKTVIRKGEEAFVYRRYNNQQSKPLQEDVVKLYNSMDIKKINTNSCRQKFHEVPAGEEPAAPADIVTFNLVLRNKDKVKLAPGLSSVLVDLVRKEEGGAAASFSQEKVFLFSEDKENPPPLKIINQVFCVVKEDSNGVRLLLNNPGTDVTLEGSKVLGQATILHAGNSAAALLKSEEQSNTQGALIKDEPKENGAKKPNNNNKNKNKNNKNAKTGAVQGVTVRIGDIKPGNRKPVVDLRSKLTAKKTAAQSQTIGVTVKKNAANQPKIEVVSGHQWVQRGPKRKNEIPATGPSPAKVARQQNNRNPVNNRPMPGNNRQMNGNNRQLTGNNRPMQGNNRPMPGNNRPMPGNNRPMPGNNRPMPGNNRQMAGNNRPMPGNNRQMAGNNRPMPGNNRQMAGNNRPMAGNNHRDTFGPAASQSRYNNSYNNGRNNSMNGGGEWKPFGPPAVPAVSPFVNLVNDVLGGGLRNGGYNNGVRQQGYGGGGRQHDTEMERRAVEQQRLAAERRMLEQQQKERLFLEEKRDRERKLHLAKLDEELMMERNRIKKMREELDRTRQSDHPPMYSSSMERVSSDRMRTGDSMGSRNTRDTGARDMRDMGSRDMRDMGARDMRDMGSRDMRDTSARDMRDMGSRDMWSSRY